jgi:hypothetical protein
MEVLTYFSIYGVKWRSLRYYNLMQSLSLETNSTGSAPTYAKQLSEQGSKLGLLHSIQDSKLLTLLGHILTDGRDAISSDAKKTYVVQTARLRVD